MKSSQNARSDLIPSIVVLLQKQWRGAIARKKYRKMRAAYHIMLYYRNWKRRQYIKQLERTFKNAKNYRDYGKSLPWPPPVICVRPVVPVLQRLFRYWRAYMILRPIPRKDWPQLKTKIVAAEGLKSRRQEWGQKRPWLGNYLALSDKNPRHAAFQSSTDSLKRSDQTFKQVRFSAFILKTNKHKKNADRAILIADNGIYKIDADKFRPMKKKPLPFSQIKGISVSAGKDQLAIVHTNTGNDLILSLGLNENYSEDLIGELVGVLLLRYNHSCNSELPVNVNSMFSCMLGKKSKSLRIEATQDTTQPYFLNEGDTIIYRVPSAFSLPSMPIRNGH